MHPIVKQEILFGVIKVKKMYTRGRRKPDKRKIKT